jgi:hypothetical protein
MLKIWEKWSKKGMQWPLAYDPISQSPSITLTCAYLTFVLAFISVIFLHIYPQTMFVPTMTAISFWAGSMVFYLLRKLTKAKFDWQNKSVELDGDEAKDTIEPAKPTSEDSIGS